MKMLLPIYCSTVKRLDNKLTKLIAYELKGIVFVYFIWSLTFLYVVHNQSFFDLNDRLNNLGMLVLLIIISYSSLIFYCIIFCNDYLYLFFDFIKYLWNLLPSLECIKDEDENDK
jgi:hypothetical protein